MKIKSFCFVLSCFLFSVFTASAQNNYLQAHFGYGFALSPKNIILDQTVNNYNSSGNTYSYTAGSKQSFGKGWQIGATFGHKINSNASLELGLNYLIGSNLTDVVTNNYNYTGQPISKDIITTINRANMLRIMPGMRISTGTKKLQLFLKGGLSFGFVTSCTRSHEVLADNGLIKTYDERKSTGGLSLGFYAGIGITYKITDFLQLIAESSFISQTWSPSKQTLIKSISNGKENDISAMNPINVESEFVEEVFNNGIIDVNKPQQFLKQYLPFSSAGFNVGIIFNFGAAEKNEKIEKNKKKEKEKNIKRDR